VLVEVFLILVTLEALLEFFLPIFIFVVIYYLYFKDSNLMYHDVTHF